jgi:NifB/MoaA-like Fe-S oxidoreductase
MAIIMGFEKGGILKKYGFKKGDDITAFDGFEYTDYLDYLFFDAKDEFDVTVLRAADGSDGGIAVGALERGVEVVAKRIKKEARQSADTIFDGSNGGIAVGARECGVEVVTKHIKKSARQSMGAIFENEDISPVSCRNKCIFCFVDQMKQGMRETLYVKDDDYRLSFISGNYITLTNMSAKEIRRVKRLKLSPLYVSVHAFDAAVRQKMLGNRFAGRLFAILKELGEADVFCHTQIVLVEGVNDGEILEETVGELYKLPSVLSVAIVPVGLTGFRSGLPEIKPLSLDLINRTIDFAENFAKKADENGRGEANETDSISNGKQDGGRGSAFVWCSDEMYIRAGRDLPPFEYYGDFCQIENGVGLAARFIHDARDYFFGYGGMYGEGGRLSCKSVENESGYFPCKSADGESEGVSFAEGSAADKETLKIRLSDKKKNSQNDGEAKKILKIEMITGASFHKIMTETAVFFEKMIKNVKIKVTAIKNNFFGESVTVAGLITGVDIAAQFKPEDDTDLILIPQTMLREFEDVFLDGTTVGGLSEALGKKITVSPSDGYDLAEFLDAAASGRT